MSTLNIGFVSSIATFSRGLSRVQREAAMRQSDVPDMPGDLRDDVCERFVSLCDFALQRLLRERSSLKTVRIQDGYGYAEHHKDWLRLGCDVVVEDDELDRAIEFLEKPENAGVLDARFEAATQEFIDAHFPAGTFHELSCALYLLEEPTNA